MIRLRTDNTHYGSLRAEDRTRDVAYSPRSRGGQIGPRKNHLKAFCLCGAKMCDTTKEDIWNGVQPRCKKCEGF